jgi:hypothetical protein
MYLLFYHTDPRFAYATSTTLNLFELKGKELIKTKLLTTDDVMESFDIDWRGDWVYWANSTGHVMRWNLNTSQTETVPTLRPGTCFTLPTRNQVHLMEPYCTGLVFVCIYACTLNKCINATCKVCPICHGYAGSSDMRMYFGINSLIGWVYPLSGPPMAASLHTHMKSID